MNATQGIPMNDTNPALDLVLQSALLWSTMVKKADQQLSVHGISFSEFCILHRLFQAPQQRLSRIELANSVGLSASGITRLLQPMEKIHLVENLYKLVILLIKFVNFFLILVHYFKLNAFTKIISIN